jgi:hypothetical protein
MHNSLVTQIAFNGKFEKRKNHYIVILVANSKEFDWAIA